MLLQSGYWRSGNQMLAGQPVPFRACAFGEVIPFIADDIPVHHWPLRAGGGVGRSERVMGVVEIGASDGQNGAEDDAGQDAHIGPPFPQPQNAAGETPFRSHLGLLGVNCDSEPAISKAVTLTLFAYQSRSNLLKILTFLPKKLCPQTKFAAILNI